MIRFCGLSAASSCLKRYRGDVATALGALRDSVDGRVITPASGEYDSLRAVYNGMVDKRPDVIVVCATAADVQRAITYARDQEQLFAVRGSGHNVAGLGTVDGNVLAVLSEMREMSVDAKSRTAFAAAGVTWQKFDFETQRHALATTGGIVHDTGISGLTLGGGLGWLMGLAGLTCDSFLRAQIVLSDGSVTEIDDSTDPELMWALRGGGGNFGVVTKFCFQLIEVVDIATARLRFKLDFAESALEAYQRFASECPDGVTSSPAFVDHVDFGKHLTIECCGAGYRKAALTALLKPLTKVSGLFESSFEETDYCQWQMESSDPYRRGLRSYWKSITVDNLGQETIRGLVESFRDAPSPSTLLTIDHVHGRAARVAADKTAYGKRSPFVILINANWEDRERDDENINWVKAAFARLTEDSAASAYVNYLDADDTARIGDAYGENLKKLGYVKQRFDPDNFFRVNQNILPVAPPIAS